MISSRPASEYCVGKMREIDTHLFLLSISSLNVRGSPCIFCSRSNMKDIIEIWRDVSLTEIWSYNVRKRLHTSTSPSKVRGTDTSSSFCPRIHQSRTPSLPTKLCSGPDTSPILRTSSSIAHGDVHRSCPVLSRFNENGVTQTHPY